VAMVVFFFSTNVINNAALNFNVPMPLHMIFRSGSLVANLVLGMIILKRRYQLSKYLSVLMITAGICLCTLASAQKLEFKFSSGDPYKDYLWWCVGIGLLVIALFLSARTGIYQEQMYAEHGKHPREALFYAHALPLAGFLLLSKDIYRHIFIFNSSGKCFCCHVKRISRRTYCIHNSKLVFSSYTNSIYIVFFLVSQSELPAPFTSSVMHACWGGGVILN